MSPAFTMASSRILHVLAAVLVMACLTTAATAQEIPTGQGGVCCAYILDSGNNWQLVCTNPGRVSWSVANQLWHVMQ